MKRIETHFLFSSTIIQIPRTEERTNSSGQKNPHTRENENEFCRYESQTAVEYDSGAFTEESAKKFNMATKAIAIANPPKICLKSE